MTITYQNRVATTSLGGFLKLLRTWRGSVYKLLYKELIIFLCLYAVISLVYRLALSEDSKRAFESIVLELSSKTSAIPLSFVLGFYVTFIVQRWWQQFINVPWPDRTLFIMMTYLHGFDDRARMMRRAVGRYLMFGLILICRAVSVSVMKRFPTLDHIVEAGFITKEEKDKYENTQCRYLKFWVPLVWANNILVTARRENKIETDFGLRMIIEQLADFRDKCSICFVYDWITVPLVYTQVVTFAVYSYFAICLFGSQYLDPSQKHKGYERDYYIPGFTILQFLFYMGWLKVAEQMINPFGEDDDDYDINWLLDRHFGVALCYVDSCYGKHPDFVKDHFWNDLEPEVPYTEASINSVRQNFLGSTFNIARPSLDAERMVVIDNDDVNTNLHGRPRGRGSFTGSLLSLLPFRHFRHQGNEDTESNIASLGSGHTRFMSVPNGKIQYHILDREAASDPERRSSIDLPVTEEADASNSANDMDDNSKKQEPQSVPSPKTSRFSVEPVKEEPGAESDNRSNAKSRRTGHTAVTFQPSDKVSRVPVLSAIEEGNTVTSLSQVIAPVAKQTTDNSVDSDGDDDGGRRDDDNDKRSTGSHKEEVGSLLSSIIEDDLDNYCEPVLEDDINDKKKMTFKMTTKPTKQSPKESAASPLLKQRKAASPASGPSQASSAATKPKPSTTAASPKTGQQRKVDAEVVKSPRRISDITLLMIDDEL